MSYKLLILYGEAHALDFHEVSHKLHKFTFCSGRCEKCAIYEDCQKEYYNDVPLITKSEVVKAKRQFPELFV